MLLLLISLAAGIAIGLLQLDITKDYLANRLEHQLQQNYNADLSIGDIDGFLPFYVQMQDVTLARVEDGTNDTLLTIDRIDSEIDAWALLQNRLTIVGFSVERPRAWLKSNEEGRLVLLDRKQPKKPRQETDREPWLSRVEIVAPDVSISEGEVSLEAKTRRHQIGNLPPNFSLKNINASLFVDWSSMQRYLDIESFTAESENLEVANIAASGQLYNDERYLELNSFYLTLGNSRFLFNGDVDGVSILEPALTGQFAAANYDIEISSEEFYPQNLHDFIADLPSVKESLYLDFRAEGSADSLWIDRAELGMRESFISLNGSVKDIIERENMAYELSFDEVNLYNQDVTELFSVTELPDTDELQSILISGQARGNLDTINADFILESELGSIELEGESQLKAPHQYSGNLSASNLDVSSFFDGRIDTTALTFDATFDGAGLTLEQAESNIDLRATDGQIGTREFQHLHLFSSLSGGSWNTKYDYESDEQRLNGTSTVDFTAEEQNLSIEGDGENINLVHFFGDEKVAPTALNFSYNIAVQGFDAERIQGRANLDIAPSAIGTDTVRAHQFYVDLNSPDAATRELRLTSSLFDMNISGDITPADVISQTKFWRDYLTNRFKAEILLSQPLDTGIVNGSAPDHNIVVDGNITAKDLGLIKRYLPDFPSITTDSEIGFNINSDGTRLLLSAEMDADTLQFDNLNFSDGNTQFTASFRSDRSFSEFSSVDWEANIRRLETDFVDVDSLGIDLAVKQDSVYYQQRAGAISDNAEFNMVLQSAIADSAINVTIEEFFLGNNQYAWVNENMPNFTYYRDGKVDFNNVSFQNQDEHFKMQGKLSKDRSDSLQYDLQDINLQRISDLIKGDIDFSGVLNGTLVTRSLTSQPTIQGDLGVNRFQLNNRMIGDVDFDSEYNTDKRQFDTRIEILTDSTKYEDYLERNDDIGQNIAIDGYFVTPDLSVQQDTLYHFDGNFEQVDLWFLALIVDNVFAEVEGQASGTGHITGNFDDYDFGSEFEIENVFARPQFLNTNYFLSGPVQFNKEEGVVLDSLSVMDTKGGTGTLWGTVDLNDFDPITYLDLSMDLDGLQFLNSEMDPDVPFYGNVSGTGLVQLSGSNTDMYLRTDDAMQVTSDSEVSIPLLEETELQETGRFVSFVDSFEDELNRRKKSPAERAAEDRTESEEAIEAVLEDMTFSERFDLDLRFDTPDDVTVNLIFDPVTGEVLTAEGTGQLRISMQDQEFQMFGQYNVSGGEYQFVTGEIISRRLELESGGTIVWEGPPDNARLDISAIYNARPNVSTLLENGETIDSENQSGGQQVPIDLIVEITGTLNSVENDYYFRLPSSLDLSSNSTLQYTLNQINRDEQQKLLQATSILFTGQFIPTQGIGGSGTTMLSQNLARGSTYLNPLLSNQVSSLLSNQINTLLNSDVSQLDIDFNLNAYNQVDLGIALRLYNDRLILRREGQITSGDQQSTPGDQIGDLNATYRIRKGLSLTAFHRQDQTLSSIQSASPQAGDVVPYVDGVGLESQVQFNTWGELMDRIRRIFTGIFGASSDSEDNE
ncbi:MAG: hypothetical protein ACQEST_06005 [Bacteroidota bacterium]